MKPIDLPSGAALWHVDWSIHARKRWMTPIVIGDGGGWVLDAARPFAEAHNHVVDPSRDLPPVLVIGLDMPIGLPAGYARAVGITDFCQFLLGEQGPDWSGFAEVSRSLDTVSLDRPFFPYHVISDEDKVGGEPRQNWLDKLGLPLTDTYRQCDLGTTERASAASLFWTKGANQVGKAALSGWADLVAPLLRSEHRSVGVWPFHGDLAELVAKHQITLVETYPGEVYGWFNCKPGSKTKQSSRRELTDQLRAVVDDLNLQLTPAAAAMLADSFGDDKAGEDRFDSFVGALGLAAVFQGKRQSDVPTGSAFRSIEGWILGQDITDR